MKENKNTIKNGFLQKEKLSNGKRVAAVTGATGQIGGAIAEGLLQQDFKVVLLCRNRDKTERFLKQLVNKYGSENVSSFIVDVSLKKSIEELANKWTLPLHVLVNNAACTPRKRKETTEGIEMQWATNVLGYFWLMKTLFPYLKTCGEGRIVNVASYWAGGLNLEDPEFKHRTYNNDMAYRQSKQADRMLTAAFAKRFEPEGITINACHPGDVNSVLSNNLGFRGHQSPAQGASTPVFLASNPSLNGITGKYFEQKQETSCSYMKDTGGVQKLIDLCGKY